MFNKITAIVENHFPVVVHSFSHKREFGKHKLNIKRNVAKKVTLIIEIENGIFESNTASFN